MRIPAIEAACLIAEALSYAFPNTQRDALRPLARAEQRDEDSWHITYARGRRGYLPIANGHFERESAGSRLSHTRPRQRLFQLLPGLRFIRGEAVGLAGRHNGYLTFEVVRRDDATCVVRATSLDCAARWSAAHIRQIMRLLDAASELRKGLDLGRDGRFASAISQLEQTLRVHRHGFSHVHDPLLANAFTALGILEYERGNLHEARRAFARGRLLLPPGVRQMTLEARLRERLAQVESCQSTLARGSLAGSRHDLESRSMHSLRDAAERLGERARTLEGSLAIARGALHDGDSTAAVHWAERALDIEPGNADALEVRAQALIARGAYREAHQHRRMARLSRGGGTASAAKILDPRAVEPALAFRSILRADPSLELIAEEATQRLVAILGAERCMRICRSEGVDVRILEEAIDWFASQHDDRSRFLSDVLTSKRRQSGSRAPRLELELRDLDPARIGGASGVRTEPKGPARPQR